MSSDGFRRLSPDQVYLLRREPADPATLGAAAAIVEEVRTGGERALRACSERYGDLEPGAPLVIGRDELDRSLRSLPDGERGLLERTAERIRRFALAQRAALSELDVAVPGGRAGQRIAPVERAGCYAPGGRFPLPSSALMTAVTARAAGVPEVWVASPRPAEITRAAAAAAGADALLASGGAHAVAALAFGAGPVPACDVVVGPGSRWVTAAKQLVSGRVGIGPPAGPSELVVLADGTASPKVVAADLLAQAEHDADALPVLVTTDEPLADRVDEEIRRQLGALPAPQVASEAIRRGFAVVADGPEQALALCDRLAPEHLMVVGEVVEPLARRLRHYGALFVGARSAEVFGDYGAGPNHTLPTGGAARFTGGLSVYHFLRIRTWLAMAEGEDASLLAEDAASLARLEGLEAHARAALLRME